MNGRVPWSRVVIGVLLLGGSMTACADDPPGAAAEEPGGGAAAPTMSVGVPLDPDVAALLEVDDPGSVPGVGPAGWPFASVGPPAGHPLERIDRDVGISVELGDGSRLWLFGDTAEREPGGGLRYFEVGTAAWAPADDPTVTRDGSVGGLPVPLVAEPSGRPPCPPQAPRSGVWPLAAVTDPGDPNRVLVWSGNICLGSSTVLESQGISLGEWRHDPARPPVDRPVQLRVLNPLLFPSQDELGAVIGVGDGRHLVAMGCRPPQIEGWAGPGSAGPAPADGSCVLRRVDVADVADSAAYEPWTGAQWGGGPPSPVDLPRQSTWVSYFAAPVGPFSLAPDPSGEGVVMVYSPWPGYVPVAAVRWAPEVTGPWSPPAPLLLEGCLPITDPRRSCYAANAQPDFSVPGELGIGYYDREVSTPPQRGAFLVGRVPFRPPGANR